MTTNMKFLLDDESLFEVQSQRGSCCNRHSSCSFDQQLMRCGFLPQNSVSCFDVKDLQDLDLNDQEDEESQEEDLSASMSASQSPSGAGKKSTLTSALADRRLAVARRLRKTFSDDDTLINMARSISNHGFDNRRRRNGRPLPQRSASARVLRRTASVLKQNISFTSS